MTVQYPYDETAENPNNRVAGEIHDLEQAEIRVFAPDHGPFYTENHALVDTATGLPLDPGTDYKLVALEQEATLYTGKEVCALVAVTNPAVSSTVSFTYQVVGGQFSTSTQAIQDLIDYLQEDGRTVDWAKIVNLPSQFPPTGHLHDINEVYGWQFVVLAIQDIVNAIQNGDQALWDQVYAYLDRQIQNVNDSVTAIYDSLTPLALHVNNVNGNPHGTTKAHVGLDKVANLAVATTSIAVQGTSNSHYMTALRTREAIDSVVATVVAETLNGYDFNVTKESVGLGEVQNFPVATLTQARNGVFDSAYMTPALVRAAIDWLRGSANGVATLDSNSKLPAAQLPPLTKDMVGLDQVQNFPVADAAAATTMTSDELYMTPARVMTAMNRYGIGTPRVIAGTIDLDTVTSVGLNWISSETTFTAAGRQWTQPLVEVQWTGQGDLVQTLIDIDDGSRSTRAKRSSGSWTAWKTVGGITEVPLATATEVGGVKMRMDAGVLYITNNGDDA